MNPFFVVLFTLLALVSIINLPFILFYLFAGIFSLFSSESDEIDFDRNFVICDVENLNGTLVFLLLPTILVAGLVNIIQNIYHKTLAPFLFLGFFLYFGWQFFQQLILFGNVSKWNFFDWILLVIYVLVVFFGLGGILVKNEPEPSEKKTFVANKEHEEFFSKIKSQKTEK